MNTPRNPFAAHDPYGTAAAQPSFGAAVPAAATAGSQAPLVYDVTEADFQARVLERSLEVPVLLDCWAPWCGPCRSLGPLLERITEAYGGAFELAKINTDEAPNLSAALRIRSIPLVVLFVGGRPVDQFTGALPEGQIRAFLDKHLQPPADPVQALLEEAAAAPAEEAEALLAEALQMVPGHPDVTAALADRLLARNADLAEVTALLDRVPAAERGERDAALRKRLALLANRPAGDPKALAARVAADPRDFEARFALGAWQVFEGDWKAAFDNLLEVVLRDKAEGRPHRERARKQLIEWFDACPDAAVVSHGRRYLGMYLN
ncbi:MAG: tetratricopeptide repeat protein [Burkholderiaceae bacterium]|jgi:putative thioredoxin|nr:tetratricopeptide repeat protein [Burkholderiaceae bacterium]MCZ8173649.1 tetratricopeptide repeat protein [Burkholderiaceae bacterium]